jgi:cytochrome c oxidase subunit 2
MKPPIPSPLNEPAIPARRRWLIRAGTLAIGSVSAAGAPFALTRVLAAQPRVIKVHARRFTFTPDKIALKANESVILELTAQDTVMGFSIPDFGVRSDIVPGSVVRLAAPRRVPARSVSCATSSAAPAMRR